MNISIFSLLIMFSFFSLNQVAYSGSSKSVQVNSRPKWIDDPQETCAPAHICAVGTGEGVMMADARARLELAKFFGVKIEGSQKQSSVTTQESSVDSLSGTHQEDIVRDLKESTDALLKGLKITKRYSGPDLHYSFAVLAKKDAENLFREKLSRIDEQIRLEVSRPKRSSYKILIKLLAERSIYEEKFSLVARSSLPAPITRQKIEEIRTQFKNNPIYIILEIKDEAIKNQVEKHLVDRDIIIQKRKDRKTNFFIKGSFSTEKQYLQVEGFEKYLVELTLTTTNLEGESVAQIHYASPEVGRSKDQVIERIHPQIKAYLDSHIDELIVE